MAGLADRCALLRSLHVPGDPLVLPNAWDAASARAVAAAGFAVVATTSAGVAEALGYADHQQAPVEEMLRAAARIVQAVEVPVTVDFEAGYGLGPAELVAALEDAGAAGCNLEDSNHAAGTLRPLEEHAAWLAEVRAAAEGRGYPLVVNARVDVFLQARERPPGELLDEAVARGRAYRAAGADCAYPILLLDEDVLGRFVAAVPGPVNAIALPDGPSRARYGELGVARISYGPVVYRRAQAALRELLERL